MEPTKCRFTFGTGVQAMSGATRPERLGVKVVLDALAAAAMHVGGRSTRRLIDETLGVRQIARQLIIQGANA